MAYTYILKCADGSYYTGSTRNLELRMDQHVHGEADSYTRVRRPVRLVYFQEFDNIGEAFAAEMQVKGWSRAKKEALVRGDYGALRVLSRSRGKPLF